MRVSLEQQGSRAQGVIDASHAQEPQDAALELAQRGHEDDRLALAHSRRVALHVLEQVDHPARRGTTTFATLGIQRQTGDRLAVHGAAEFTLQQRLGQERKKVNAPPPQGVGFVVQDSSPVPSKARHEVPPPKAG